MFKDRLEVGHGIGAGALDGDDSVKRFARSSERPAQIAAKRGARVLLCDRMRARQFNRGAEAAANDILIFLHGDTTLPTGAVEAVPTALETCVFGGFRLAFEEPSWKLRIAE